MLFAQQNAKKLPQNAAAAAKGGFRAEFLADLDKRKFDLDPVPGEELEKIVKDVMNQPPDIIARMKKLLGE